MVKQEQLPLYHWDYSNAMFFAGTLFTTIGYGNISAKTFYGRIATIIYATIGIPLMLTVLNDLGKLIFVWARHLWHFFRRFVRYNIILPWRYRKEPAQTKTERMMSQVTEETGTDVDHNFPLPLALFIVFLYTFLCAMLFNLWEHNRDYFTGFYFFFISLSTIGLGDVLPDNPHFTSATFGLFIVGLALVSMCINVMQAKVEAKYMAALELIEEAYLDDDPEVGGSSTGLDDLSPPPTALPARDRQRQYRNSSGNGSFNDDETGGGGDRASLGVIQVGSMKRPNSRGSSGGKKREADSPKTPTSPKGGPMSPRKLKAIAEKDENSINL